MTQKTPDHIAKGYCVAIAVCYSSKSNPPTIAKTDMKQCRAQNNKHI